LLVLFGVPSLLLLKIGRAGKVNLPTCSFIHLLIIGVKTCCVTFPLSDTTVGKEIILSLTLHGEICPETDICYLFKIYLQNQMKRSLRGMLTKYFPVYEKPCGLDNTVVRPFIHDEVGSMFKS
jgi:hypothetical protein